jgi:hypothetical protein
MKSGVKGLLLAMEGLQLPRRGLCFDDAAYDFHLTRRLFF